MKRLTNLFLAGLILASSVMAVMPQHEAKAASYLVAATNAPAGVKAIANYVTDNISATQVQTLLTQASGGTITFTGNFTSNPRLLISSNTNIVFTDSVNSTVTLANGVNTDGYIFQNTNPAGNTGITITGGRFVGNEANQTAGSQYAFRFDNVTASSVDSWVEDFRTADELMINSSVTYQNRNYADAYQARTWLLNGFENTTDWTLAGGIVSTNTSTDHTQGTFSNNWTTNATIGEKSLVFANPIDLRFFPQLVIEYKDGNGTNDIAPLLLLYNTAGSFVTLPTSAGYDEQIDNGWRRRVYDIAFAPEWATQNQTSFLRDVKKIRLRMYAGDGSTLSVLFDNLYAVRGLPTNITTLVFDDGYASEAQQAPYMNGYGFAGVLAAVSGKFDQAGWITTSEVQTLKNYGWDIGDHSYDHSTSFPTNNSSTEPAILWEHTENIRVLNSLGYGATSQFAYYTGGMDNLGWTDAVNTHWARRYFGYDPGGSPVELSSTNLPYGYSPLYLNSRPIGDNTTNLQFSVNQSKKWHTWIFLSWHQIDALPGHTPVATFQSQMDWLWNNGINVQTTSEVFATYPITETVLTGQDGYRNDTAVSLNTNAWADNAYPYRIKWSGNMSAISENLTGLPTLVHLTNSNIDFTKVASNGTGIKFYDRDNTTVLPFEFDSTNVTASIAAHDLPIWVSKTWQSSSNFTDYFWIYYGNQGTSRQDNPTAVWDSNYKLVSHMSDNGTDTNHVLDSTSNHFNGTKGGTTNPTQATGLYSNGQLFNASDNNTYIDFGDIDTTNTTVETYYKLNTIASTYQSVMSKGDPSLYANSSWNAVERSPNFSFFFARKADDTGYTNTAPSTQSATATWIYRTLIINSPNNIYDYRQGAVLGSANLAGIPYPDQSSLTVRAGRPSTVTGNSFNGTMEEYRISNIVRSDGWIKATYLNLSSSFLQPSTEEAFPPVPGIITRISNVTMNKDAVLSGNFSGNLTSLNGQSTAQGWIDYGLTLSYGSNTANTTYNSIGIKTVAFPALTPGQTYHARFVVQSVNGTNYGDDATIPLTLPSVTTGTPTNVGSTATLNGNISSMGVASSTYAYFTWSQDGISHSTALQTKSATGAVTATITFDPNKPLNVIAITQVGTVTSTGSWVTLNPIQGNTFFKTFIPILFGVVVAFVILSIVFSAGITIQGLALVVIGGTLAYYVVSAIVNLLF